MALVLIHPFAGMSTRSGAQLLTDQIDATDGEWIDLSHIGQWSIQIKGMSSPDVCQVRVSCEIDEPDSSEHGVPFGTNIKKNQRIVSGGNHRFRWGKVMKKTGGGSATNAWIFGNYEVSR